jgi:threonine synthase
LLDAVRAGSDAAAPVASTTRVSGLSVPFDLDATLALGLMRRNGGSAIGVSDDDVFAAQAQLFRDEGICAEPAGAASFAGYLKARESGVAAEGEPSICLVTGHGLKDFASIERLANITPSPRCDAAGLRELLPQLVEGM